MNPIVSKFVKINLNFYRKTCQTYSQLSSIDVEGLRGTSAIYDGDDKGDTNLKKL